MIYNRDQSEVAVLGEVQKYKVGIDERNINHIVTILSSNLYSYPMTSFLRETVSNAVDSHIEAGVDEPIIVTVTGDTISIRDFGTGISPERFQEIYLNIGSSTKRESNDYIGSFGIGRFSCLSISDLANITSFYNGKAYYYVMNKDVDQLHIDLLFEKDTDEKNGVEVKVPTKKFNSKDIECLSFIENVYVDSDGYFISQFNKRKIYSYKNFKLISVASQERESKTEILLGKIPYVVDYNTLWDWSDDWHKSWKETFECIYPTIEIEKLDITPNRENLLYSERTKEVLRKAYDACIEELIELWNVKCSKEYEDIKEFAEELTCYRRNNIVLHNLDIPMSSRLAFNALYKYHKEWENISPKRKKELISIFLNKEIDVLCTIDDNIIRQGKSTKKWFTLRKLFNSDWLDDETTVVLALPSKAGFSSQYFKAFLNWKYGIKDKLILRQLPPVTLHSFRQFIRTNYGITLFSDTKEIEFVFQFTKEILNYLKDKIIVADIIGSPEYAKYKKDNAMPKNGTRQHTGKITFTITDTNKWSSDKQTCSLAEIIPYLRSRHNVKYNRKARIVYSELENPFISALGAMQYPNLIVLSASKSNMKYLKEGLPEWVRPIEELYSPDNRILQRYAAMSFISKQPNIDLSFPDWRGFPQPIRDKFRKLREYKNRYLYLQATYSSIDAAPIISIVPPEKYDKQILALYHDTYKYLQISYKLRYNLSCEQYYLLMKAKKFRLDFDFYRALKDTINDLLNTI